MTWERNRNHHELSDNTAGKNIRSLENLMTFLRQEVQGEEMVVLSRTGFASNNVTHSASQYSHVSERLIAHLGLIPHRYENIIHSLFGGTQTKPKERGVYSIELTALNGDYSCCLEVLSEEKICDSVPKITDEQILNNLRELNIEFSDSFSEDLEIDLLVGSNVLGRILMKKCCELDSGLSVVETKLGNTVIGMLDDVCHIDRNVMTTLSMYVRNFKLTDLWNLESLGISNPTLEESKQNSYEDALNDFQQKLAILPNGRVHVEERELSELSSDDIENAERVLIRLVQDKMFPNLKSIPIVNVFKDNEGIIRVKTKITERKDDPNFIALFLMPSKCLLTTRLIEYYHVKHCHAGVQILMSILREKFWIMKTRKTVREVVMKCVPCRRYSSNSPMSEPVSLPADRVKDANAFDITGKAILTYEELLTVLCDCEAVVNSRPLTYVSEDPNDLIPLTPSLFLNGKSSYDTVDLDLKKEYLGQLRQTRPGKPGHDFKVGDVVMIEEPSKKRVYWPLGKVISLLPGRDGKVRTLKLKCKNSELIRPIQRVYPLEVPFINNEIVKIDGVPTSSVNEDKLTSNAVIKNKVTRSGRLVKIPERLGLFNEVLYAFE
ncbi:uncharacterized protein TNCV_3711571 [Trichonephila clavipes]|uniref:Integrase zinc-binding domain-containing protein n=1 Tax=Trichonephila clavipes TaxID=2585209 RepID=A0A8X6R8Z6_TRICX|nr:uncharacterized protein TNCV_3711571 [Trichonephila clavipes]